MKKLSVISTMHYIRLVYRSVLFVLLFIGYIKFRLNSGDEITDIMDDKPVIMIVIWFVFAFEMVMRFLPSRIESPGCQKQFPRNYIKTGSADIDVPDNNGTLLVALVWIVFNGIFGALHNVGVLDNGEMILLFSCYSVCDMICILFFCPFQSWFLKNKCCVACRIYNWDYAMMFTPLFFVGTAYAWSLLALSVGLLLRWEITFYLHPERFSEKTNAYLECANCTEKLCTHKKQLEKLRKQIEAYTAERVRKLTEQ